MILGLRRRRVSGPTPASAAAKAPQEAVATPAPSRPPRAMRTAVLVIHGIGNQRPLATLRAAADAIYASDPAFAYAREAGAPDLWLTFDRDDIDRDVDLPMLTTADIAKPGERPHFVDFHECYWAHVMGETRFVAVPLWLFELIRKGPGLMRSRIRALWPIIALLGNLWIVALVLILLALGLRLTGSTIGHLSGALIVWGAAAVATGLMSGRNGAAMMVGVFVVATGVHRLLGVPTPLPLSPLDPTDLWIGLGLILSFVMANTFVLLTVVGDAARYYRNAPENIAVRRATRKLAADRLRALHRDPQYDRVIVVSHSLGTVIGYDMLRAYWSEICFSLGDPRSDAAFATQDDRKGDDPAFDAAAWRGTKPALLAKLPELDRQAKRPHRWLVTDFITLGSPLTHAAFLMADGRSRRALEASFERKRCERELPQDPAWHVGGDGSLIFDLPEAGRSFFHAGGMFGVTRWTNIYFPLRWTLFGDVVGGAVQDVFGAGVDDRAAPIGPFPSIAAHTSYFDTTDPLARHLTLLREAVDLGRRTLG